MNNSKLEKKDVIKLNGNDILKKEDKFFYVIISGGKPKIISASRSKTSGKKEAISILNIKFDKIKKILKDDKTIKMYRLTIRKVTKEEKNEHKKSSIDMIGGIIVIILEEVNINISKKSIKLTINNLVSNSNRIFIDNKYLKKYNVIDDKLLKKISYKYSINKIDGGFTINKLSHFI